MFVEHKMFKSYIIFLRIEGTEKGCKIFLWKSSYKLGLNYTCLSINIALIPVCNTPNFLNASEFKLVLLDGITVITIENEL